MKVLPGIIFAWSVRGSLSLLSDVGLLFGAKRSALASEDNWMKTPEAIEAVIKDALDRNREPKRLKHQFRPLVMDAWEKDKDSILVMVNEAAHNYKFVEYVMNYRYPAGLNIPWEIEKKKLDILQDLRTYSSQILNLVKQKLFDLGSKVSPSVIPKTNVAKCAENTSISRGGLRREPRVISGVGKALGSIKHIQTLQNSGLNRFFGNRCNKWRELGSDPRGLGEPLLGAKNSDDSFTGTSSEKGFPQAIIFPHQIILEQEILKGLKDCLLEITFRKSVTSHTVTLPAFWIELFEQSVFQQIEFMYKYNFIKLEELSHWYESQPDILEITGPHIGIMLASDDGNFKFPQIPDGNYQIMDWKLDYMRHSLIGLNERSQRKVIHAAFSLNYPSELTSYGWEMAPPHTDEIYSFISKEDFPVLLSNWNLELTTALKSKELIKNVSQLIDNLSNPPKTIREVYGGNLICGYQFNVVMLEYITQNISNDQFLSVICDWKGSKYKKFKPKFGLLITGRRLECLHSRWSKYMEFMKSEIKGVVSRNQVKCEMNLIENECKSIGQLFSNLNQELNADQESLAWMDNKIIDRLMSRYCSCLTDINVQTSNEKMT